MTQLITQVANESPRGTRAIKLLSAAVGLPRATFYRRRGQIVQPASSAKFATELRQAIQRIALEMPSYGYRPMTAELRRRGWLANHKQVLQLMRAENLLCRPRRRFVRTTESTHTLPVFPNLTRDLVLTAANQLWVADITYLRLSAEFVYLAVILDAFSRRVIGWALDRQMLTKLTLTALRMALSSRQVKAGLVHHSDRGVQYAAADYVSLLLKHQIRISMSRTANPYDNAKAERFMRTLKHEEVYFADYQTLTEARASINHFINEVYNRKRLHSALGYLPPVEFEHRLSSLTCT
jgi:putative transposase